MFKTFIICKVAFKHSFLNLQVAFKRALLNLQICKHSMTWDTRIFSPLTLGGVMSGGMKDCGVPRLFSVFPHLVREGLHNWVPDLYRSHTGEVTALSRTAFLARVDTN